MSQFWDEQKSLDVIADGRTFVKVRVGYRIVEPYQTMLDVLCRS